MAIRVKYSYSEYKNCPRATDYSESASRNGMFLSMGMGLMVFFSAFWFIGGCAQLWDPHSTENLLKGLAMLVVFTSAEFVVTVSRHAAVDDRVRAILAEEKQIDLPDNLIKPYLAEVRKKNADFVRQSALEWCVYFVLIVVEIFSLIAVIQNGYFVHIHRGGMLPLVVFSVLSAADAGVQYALMSGKWKLPLIQNKPRKEQEKRAKKKNRLPPGTPLSAKAKEPQKENLSLQNATEPKAVGQTINSAGSQPAAFCGKCGEKLEPGDLYCTKCGAKVK